MKKQGVVFHEIALFSVLIKAWRGGQKMPIRFPFFPWFCDFVVNFDVQPYLKDLLGSIVYYFEFPKQIQVCNGFQGVPFVLGKE